VHTIRRRAYIVQAQRVQTQLYTERYLTTTRLDSPGRELHPSHVLSRTTMSNPCGNPVNDALHDPRENDGCQHDQAEDAKNREARLEEVVERDAQNQAVLRQ